MGISTRLIIGLLVPFALVLAAVLLVPAGVGGAFGVSLRSWLLFGCAPVTSLMLFASLDREPRR